MLLFILALFPPPRLA